MRKIIELISGEVEKEEPTVIDKSKILDIHSNTITLLLENRKIQDKIKEEITKLSNTLSYIRFSKFLNNYLPQSGIDRDIALFLHKLLKTYSLILSGNTPLTNDIRIPIKITEKVRKYKHIFKLNEGDILLLPLSLALILVSLDIAVIVK